MVRLVEAGERNHRHERRHESTKRSIRLPEGVHEKGVIAWMKHGVLLIELPKLEVEDSPIDRNRGEPL